MLHVWNMYCRPGGAHHPRPTRLAPGTLEALEARNVWVKHQIVGEKTSVNSLQTGKPPSSSHIPYVNHLFLSYVSYVHKYFIYFLSISIFHIHIPYQYIIIKPIIFYFYGSFVHGLKKGPFPLRWAVLAVPVRLGP